MNLTIWDIRKFFFGICTTDTKMDFSGRICYGNRLEYFCRSKKIGIKSEYGMEKKEKKIGIKFSHRFLRKFEHFSTVSKID